MSSPDAQPLTRPPRTNHLPFVVLLGAPAVLLVLLLTLGYRYSSRSPSQNVTMGDRSFVVAVPELLDATKNTGGYDAKAEVLRKTKLARGGRELEYRFAGTRPPWLVSSRIIAELDTAQAQATFTQLAERDLVSPGLSLAPLEMPWGDEAMHGTLQRDGVTVGHYFLGRKGTRVVLYRLEGLVLAPPLSFEAFITPRLVQAETFVP